MCGIVGYICNSKAGFTSDEVKAVHDMLYVNSLRGEDSTGLFYVTNQGDTQVHKDLGISGKFLKTKEWEATDKELFNRGLAVVGHCRAATRGGKTEENAHPFIVDNKIVLVHNGSLMTHRHLANTDVDSHAIAHVLAEEDDIATALSRVQGAYALVWYNVETQRLHAIRNKERPLVVAEFENDAMMFASEASFIYLASWRNGLKIKQDGIRSLEPGELLTVDLANIKKAYKYEKINCEYKPPVSNTAYVPPANRLPFVEEREGVPGVKSISGRVLRPTMASLFIQEAAQEIGFGEYIPVAGKINWRDFAKIGQECFIEATDYCPKDSKDSKNKNYFVFGKICTADKNLNDFACGWEIECESEELVLQYVSTQFFRGQVEYGVQKSISINPLEVITALFKMHTVTPIKAMPVDLVQ